MNSLKPFMDAFHSFSSYYDQLPYSLASKLNIELTVDPATAVVSKHFQPLLYSTKKVIPQPPSQHYDNKVKSLKFKNDLKYLLH